MELYELSVFVLFPAALVIFALGAVYRIARFIFLYERGVYIRRPTSFGNKVKELVMTFVRPVFFATRNNPVEGVGGVVFLHFLGLILLVFLLSPHIAYLQHLIPFYGILWPLAIPPSASTGSIQVTTPTGHVQQIQSIWGPLTVLLNGDILTVFAIIGISYKMVKKVIEKVVHRSRRVRMGDLVIWPLLLVIVVTGWLATHHYPPELYRFLLGLHIASAATFVVLWPFTKYFHFLWSFWYGKIHEWYDLTIKRGT